MSGVKFPRALAITVARDLVKALEPYCERLIVAGSLRRRKIEVGDVEIVYIPKMQPVPVMRQADLLAPGPRPEFISMADARINALAGFYWDEASQRCKHREEGRVLCLRRTVRGAHTWGDKNKLAVHLASGVPVDLFRATEANWFNYLVCRTGSAESNVRICTAAQNKGWKWHPYGLGFTDQEGMPVRVESEEDVFRLVGLPYLQPWER